MNNLKIEGGQKTPYVHFEHVEGRLEIRGKSIPENSVEFYHPVFTWLDEYASKPHSKTQVIIQLEYFNTSSSKCLLDIFRRLEKLHGSASEVNITWLFEEEDEDMQEAGDDYQSIVKIPFTISKAE